MGVCVCACGKVSKRPQGGGVTSGFRGEQDAISVCKVLAQVAGGVAGPGNAGDLQDPTAAQLVQHQAGIKGGGHLSCVGLHTPHKVQLSPAAGLPVSTWIKENRVSRYAVSSLQQALVDMQAQVVSTV